MNIEKLKTLRVIMATSLIAALVMVALILLYVPCEASIVTIYASGVRNSFFTGFLTVGGFLLSMKTYVVIKLKEQVYDSDGYLINLKKHRDISESTVYHYGPLKRLSDLLFYAVSFALITAACQLTIGLFENIYTVMFCIFLASFSLVLLFSSLMVIKSNLNDWFDYLEAQSLIDNPPKPRG